MSGQDENDIESAFLKRYHSYRQGTKEILKSMPNVIDAIKATLAGSEQYETLAWDDVQYLATQGVIVLIGTVEVEVGDNIKLDTGKIVEVTEENVGTLQRLVRVAIPINLAKTGTAEEIEGYLSANYHTDYSRLQEEDFESPYGEDFELPGDEPINLEGEEEPMYNEDYSAELDLTDEQYQQMIITPQSKKIH